MHVFTNVRGAGAPLNVSNGGQDANGFIYCDTNGDSTKDTRGLIKIFYKFWTCLMASLLCHGTEWFAPHIGTA
ncbi:MAG: hypothetical protein IPH28_19970 [Cytophagaceae bacterium]|nr:hypothetical protein [Cytophagaceae bacterium]